jgi:hypothetical protein
MKVFLASLLTVSLAAAAVRAADHDPRSTSARIEQLEKKIAELERAIAELKSTRAVSNPFVVVPGARGQVPATPAIPPPKNGTPFEFNGETYYAIPLERNDPAPVAPVTKQR